MLRPNISDSAFSFSVMPPNVKLPLVNVKKRLTVLR
jgi:hypothetical protein